MRSSGAAGEDGQAGDDAPRSLGTLGRLVFSLGDHSVNLSLSALSLFFLFFLTEVAHLRADLAGAVVWLARLFDAVTDPLIGRYSDTRRWRLGRRRPFFLIGMLPFALAFALIWQTPFDAQQGQLAAFAYYTAVYMALSLATTVLSVPYLALLPEMATDYHERTVLNAWRAAAAVAGTLLAAGMRAVADGWGGDAAAYGAAGACFAIWLLMPWPAVYAVSFERPESAGTVTTPALSAAATLARHANYRRLSALFVSARIAVDLSAASLAYYMPYWIGRPEDLVPTIVTLLVASIASLPLWLHLGARYDKHRLFVVGAGLWAVLLLVLFQVTPEWPRPLLFGLIALTGIGYCAADLMPWAMIGEVIDEDELHSGERREGLYNGFFTFIRKIAGATAVAILGVGLQLSGYVPNVEQTPGARLAIRSATALVPAFFLGLAILVAARYPLGRARHAQIRASILARRRGQR